MKVVYIYLFFVFIIYQDFELNESAHGRTGSADSNSSTTALTCKLVPPPIFKTKI